MPIFEYRCNSCSTRFEKIVFSQEAKPTCPKCGSEEAEKLLSSFAVHANTARAASPTSQPCPCPCGAAERGTCQMMAGN